MTKASFSNVVHVKLGGAKLPDKVADDLVEAWVDLGAGVPGAFQLTFRDPHGRLLGEQKVRFGTKVVVSPVADGRGAQTPLLTGEVTGMESEYDGTGTFTVIRGYDKGHRLMRQRRVAAYRNQTASDIARKLARQSGIPLGRITPTKTVYEFISQANVSDWDFLSRLADENERVMSLDARGRFCFVTPDPAAKAPPTSTEGDKSAFVLHAGKDVLRCRAAISAADQIGKVESRGWDVTTKKAVTATATATSTQGVAIGKKPAEAAKAFRGQKLVETGVPYDKQAEAKNATNSLADDVASSFAELEVTVRGNPQLRPGLPVTLRDVGVPFEGKYTATSVRHVFADDAPYQTWVTVSGRQWRSLYGLTSGGDGGGAAKLPSVANALVTDVQDPLKQGRVKLRFPWLDGTYVSDWTRTVQLGGTAGGGIFPLDVGDEVVVAFDRGALDHPFVIGGLYNGRDKPTPVKDVPLHDGVRKKAARHTLSDRQGNRVDLLSQGSRSRKQGVRVASGDDKLTVNLDRTKTEITVTSKGAVRIKGSGAVSVDAGTRLDLRGRQAVTIRSGGPLTLQGQGAVNLGSLGGLVNVNAAGALSLRAAAAASLAAGGAATVNAGGTVQIQAAANLGLRAATHLINGVVLVNNKPYPIP
ncbi:VgrG-related protein [Streptomyces sp. HNM0574]|uniref:VgrG-related protein n=1 Tax=Streptomyces sp. HNM0574 TaxID=2714954 RepID=UPI00146A4B2B|nr:VgrG-related protein [Streptomyces sp. HNM0574]NLU69483.1 VgrG-related protein [Streptomyces sp. HNM0574]